MLIFGLFVMAKGRCSATKSRRGGRGGGATDRGIHRGWGRFSLKKKIKRKPQENGDCNVLDAGVGWECCGGVDSFLKITFLPSVCVRV